MGLKTSFWFIWSWYFITVAYLLLRKCPQQQKTLNPILLQHLILFAWWTYFLRCEYKIKKHKNIFVILRHVKHNGTYKIGSSPILTKRFMWPFETVTCQGCNINTFCIVLHTWLTVINMSIKISILKPYLVTNQTNKEDI